MKWTDYFLVFFGVMACAAVTATAGGWLSLKPDNSQQEQVICYSGGHVIFEELCEECHGGNGYVQGVTADGAVFHVQGDCIIAPADYEGVANCAARWVRK